ncbi:MAG: hypothetical protein CM15mP74_14430 [Halieaceae bacterium]|nr:MAG: hypothetical protein CM15mP74_14430 [Halieaceae bacterium]
MRYLHTMIRAANLDDTLDFFVDKTRADRGLSV